MRLGSVAAGLAVLASASVCGAATPGKGEASADPNREICKSRPVVGSRVQRVRECHTAQQWEEMKFAERNGLNRQQFNGAQSEAPPEMYLPSKMAAQQPQR